MERVIQLIGEWEFVGAEKFTNTKWVSNSNFTAGMTWFITPQIIDYKVEYGIITENSKVKSRLAYKHLGDMLMIDYSIDEDISISTDDYKVEVISPDSIYLSIQNEPNCPPPYFRYRLNRTNK